MSYLDDMSAIFDLDTDTANSASSCIDAPCVEVEGETPLEAARRQLRDNDRAHFHESPEGTFRGCGSRHGVGYAEAIAVLDPQTGLADIDIDAHLRVAPEAVKGTRKLFRRLNQQFIVPGLAVDEDGSVHFRTERPCDPLKDDLSEWLGKGFTTVHAHAYMVAQINAGMEPWDVLQASENADKERAGGLEGLLEALRGAIS